MPQDADTSKPPISGPRLGLIGGLSYHSTLIYYQKINHLFAERFGAQRSAPLLIYSHDFGEVVKGQETGNWQRLEQVIRHSARVLMGAGCDTLMIASNTIHKFARRLEKQEGCNLLHIADAVGEQLHSLGLHRVGLLGTRPTMEEPFYRRRLADKWGLEVLIPATAERHELHQLIFQQLVAGECPAAAQLWFARMVEGWQQSAGFEGLILGCTELNMLLTPAWSIPFVDSLMAHCQAGMRYLEQVDVQGGGSQCD
jgi:aspartate racemase